MRADLPAEGDRQAPRPATGSRGWGSLLLLLIATGGCLGPGLEPPNKERFGGGPVVPGASPTASAMAGDDNNQETSGDADGADPPAIDDRPAQPGGNGAADAASVANVDEDEDGGTEISPQDYDAGVDAGDDLNRGDAALGR